MKKQETVLSVLMYIFHHHMEKEKLVNLNDTKLVDELKSAGFHAHTIGKAFRWLHHLSEFAEDAPIVSQNSFRVFSEEECQVMSSECRQFILSLEQQGILTAQTREAVIHQTLSLIQEGVDISLIKWVTLMVLFNFPNCEDALQHMEFLVHTDAFDTAH